MRGYLYDVDIASLWSIICRIFMRTAVCSVQRSECLQCLPHGLSCLLAYSLHFDRQRVQKFRETLLYKITGIVDIDIPADESFSALIWEPHFSHSFDDYSFLVDILNLLLAYVFRKIGVISWNTFQVLFFVLVPLPEVYTRFVSSC